VRLLSEQHEAFVWRSDLLAQTCAVGKANGFLGTNLCGVWEQMSLCLHMCGKATHRFCPKEMNENKESIPCFCHHHNTFFYGSSKRHASASCTKQKEWSFPSPNKMERHQQDVQRLLQPRAMPAHPTTSRLAATSSAAVPTVRQVLQAAAAPQHQEGPPIDMDCVIWHVSTRWMKACFEFIVSVRRNMFTFCLILIFVVAETLTVRRNPTRKVMWTLNSHTFWPGPNQRPNLATTER